MSAVFSQTIRQAAVLRWALRTSERRALLLFADILAASAAVVLATWLSGVRFSGTYPQAKVMWWLGLVLGWVLLNLSLYDVRQAASWRATGRAILAAAAVFLVAYLVIFFFSPRGLLPRLFILYYLGGAVIFTLLCRLGYIAAFVVKPYQRRALIAGAGWAGETILKALVEDPINHNNVLGFVDDDARKRGTIIGGVPILGDHRRLLQNVRALQISEIVLAVTGEIQGEMFQALLDCQAQGISVVRMSALYEQITGRVPIDHLEADWMTTSFAEAVHPDWLTEMGERLLNTIGAVLGLIVLAGLFPWIAAAIWLETGSPILYRQVRAGRGGRPFTLYKFRTMVVDAEADGQPRWADEDDARVTRVGWFLRRTRLDETPQFWNVLRGDMSLVGPRPERPEFIATLEKEIPFYRARLSVQPGITGWAQVNYGYGATVAGAAVKLQWDLYYIKHQSLWLDWLILVRTVGVVLGFTGT